MPARAATALLALILAACGAGSGEGLDQNGRPLGAGSGALVPTFTSIQTNVFSVYCAVPGCHGGSSAQFGLQLDPGFSYGNLVNVDSPRDPNPGSPTYVRVIPGDPDNSFIIRKLEGTQALGDRMPLGGPYLPQSMIDVIRQWIANGAPMQ